MADVVVRGGSAGGRGRGRGRGGAGVLGGGLTRGVVNGIGENGRGRAHLQQQQQQQVQQQQVQQHQQRREGLRGGPEQPGQPAQPGPLNFYIFFNVLFYINLILINRS